MADRHSKDKKHLNFYIALEQVTRFDKLATGLGISRTDLFNLLIASADYYKLKIAASVAKKPD
jgi:hypothetical protein